MLRWLGCGLLTLAAIASPAQSAPPSASKEWFDQITGIESAGIINGTEYKMAMMSAASNPFFGTGEFKGQVLYENQWYSVTLLFDAFKDALVVKHLSATGRAWFIELDKTRVQQFVLSGRTFKNLSRGYNEIIFDSPQFQVVCKRAKVSQLKNRVFTYITHDEFFIIESGRWRPLRSKGAFLKLVESKEDKAAVTDFIRQNGIRFRKFRSEDLQKIATFINRLRASL